eukprot:s4_g13.t1
MDSGLVLQAPRSRAAAFGCESPPGNPIGGQFGQCRSCRDRPLCGESSKPLDSLDRNIFGFTMLHCAAGHRSAAALEELLVQCRPEKPDLSRALFDAAVVRSGSAELVQRLIGLRADIDFRYSMPRRVGLAKDRREKRINWPVGQRFNDEEREKRQKEAEEKAKEEEARLLREQEREKESLATPEVAETQQEEERGDNINAKVSAMVEPTASGAVEPEHEEAADFRNVTLLKRPQESETGITALMPPPGARISQAPPKVENYQVPSFLRKKQQKKS